MPYIFQFLVMLSYEKFHSKSIIDMPRIIHRCDGIMASGLQPTTHGELKFFHHWIYLLVFFSITEIHSRILDIGQLFRESLSYKFYLTLIVLVCVPETFMPYIVLFD